MLNNNLTCAGFIFQHVSFFTSDTLHWLAINLLAFGTVSWTFYKTVPLFIYSYASISLFCLSSVRTKASDLCNIFNIRQAHLSKCFTQACRNILTNYPISCRRCVRHFDPSATDLVHILVSRVLPQISAG